MSNNNHYNILFVSLSVIIQAAEVILNKYDLRISNRYKLINYEEEDAVRNLKVGPDHFLEVTVPAVAVMLMGVIFVLLCARWVGQIFIRKQMTRS